MTDRAEHFDDELLSAYVDGELTGEQLALVEQRLAEDPDARQLVDELRALSREVRALPKQALGEDLRATIMQHAERSMLLGAEVQPPRRSADDSSSRRWVWAALAIAAALLLMFVTPGDQLELKPIANVKPIPADRPAGEMRIEAVESEIVASEAVPSEAIVADSDTAVEGATAAAGDALLTERRQVAETLPAVRSRSLSAPPVAASAAAGARELDNDEIDPAFHVHITLNEGESNFANFNRMLVSNGIELEDADAEADAEKFVDRRDQAAGAKVAATSRNIRKLEKNLQTIQEEVFLVEAPPENIENVLLGCSLDTSTCASVRVEAEDGKSAELPIQNLSQYSRSGKQVRLKQQSSLKRAQQAIAQSQQGRAMRLKTDQYQYAADGQFNLQQKMLSKGKLATSKTAQSPVQVLFILQQALGEPTAAGSEVDPRSEP